ncbi:MAG: TonB family protein [Candidatus Eremiobacteraeota bacterium]|nr:TonB family protein [Candidatus Eremiobacteraeota bacterium]
MTAQLRIAAPVLAALVAVAGTPAFAQYATEFTPARLIKQGTTSTSVAGSGTVVVQVQVNADGTHKAIKVIHSTRSGDNAAAMEIAQNSSYRPAHRGSTPVTSFYDFTLKFNGKMVAGPPEEGTSLPAGGALSPAAAAVAALIRQHQYEQAKSKAQSELLSAPGDESLRQMLGIAAFDAGDLTTAAAAFDRVGTIGPRFKPIAAQSFASAAVKQAQSDPAQSLTYAQKAMSLDPGPNSRFALGVAQLANGDNATALQTLKSAHDALISDTKVPVASKVNVDAELVQAYLLNHDMAGAQSIAAQIKQLDPSSMAGVRAMGISLIVSGNTAAEAKNLTGALADYDQAAGLGDPSIAVTANARAAFAVAGSEKPDYKRMQAYAEKALAIKPDDPLANFAEGVALTGQWASSHDDATKKKAADALGKAEQQARAEGDEALALQIETFLKKNLNTSGG